MINKNPPFFFALCFVRITPREFIENFTLAWPFSTIKIFKGKKKSFPVLRVFALFFFLNDIKLYFL